MVAPLLEALDNAGIGLLITADGPNGLERLYENRTVMAILGRDAEALRATPVMAALPPDERARLQALREQIQAGHASPPVIETAVMRPDGTRVPIELGIANHRDGDRTYAFVSLRDLSERRAMQTRLLEADRLSTVGALCAGLAHEINNPLTYVLLQVGALRRTLDRWVPDATSRAHVDGVLETVLTGCDRVSAAVRELLVFADPAIGRPGPVDLRAVVEGAMRAAAPIVEARARLESHLADVATVDGDPPRLGQAVLNLIIEASLAFDQHDRERNTIDVRLHQDDARVTVEVLDNGRDVDAHGAANAFEPFFRVRGGCSTGIGLAVTRTIVTALGGSATLASRPGGGAVATIQLPRRHE